jgi:hypothetical protein
MISVGDSSVVVGLGSGAGPGGESAKSQFLLAARFTAELQSASDLLVVRRRRVARARHGGGTRLRVPFLQNLFADVAETS